MSFDLAKGWFMEANSQWSGSAMALEVEEILHEAKSDYQVRILQKIKPSLRFVQALVSNAFSRNFSPTATDFATFTLFIILYLHLSHSTPALFFLTS